MQRTPGAKFSDDGTRKNRGAVFRFALGQVDQDIGKHLVAVARKLASSERVGKILLGGKGPRLLVRGLLRQRVDRGAGRLVDLLREIIGMDREEHAGSLL